MVLLQRGDHSAFGELYNRYSVKMHRYFYRMLGQDEILASDHTQDLFLHVLERPQLFDANRRFSTWLYAIASNRCKNVYRAWSRKPATLELADRPIVAKEISPPEKLDSAIFNDALQKAISTLPDVQKECFILRYQEELSIKEIVEIIECPAGTVKSRLHYALKYLANNLQAFNPKPSEL